MGLGELLLELSRSVAQAHGLPDTALHTRAIKADVWEQLLSIPKVGC